MLSLVNYWKTARFEQNIRYFTLYELFQSNWVCIEIHKNLFEVKREHKLNYSSNRAKVSFV